MIALKDIKSFICISMDNNKVVALEKKSDLFKLNLAFKAEQKMDSVIFKDNTLFEKSFEFRKNTINKAFIEKVPLLGLKGVLRH